MNRLRSSFVPRPHPVRTVYPRVGWSTSLTGWARTGWALTSSTWSSCDRPQRSALIKTARRWTKRTAAVTVRVHPGGITTTRPVGVRMGTGKGKPHGTRRWIPKGLVVVQTVGSRPARLALLKGRSSSKLTLHLRHY